jgi:hypothetical protein
MPGVGGVAGFVIWAIHRLVSADVRDDASAGTADPYSVYDGDSRWQPQNRQLPRTWQSSHRVVSAPGIAPAGTGGGAGSRLANPHGWRNWYELPPQGRAELLAEAFFVLAELAPSSGTSECVGFACAGAAAIVDRLPPMSAHNDTLVAEYLDHAMNASVGGRGAHLVVEGADYASYLSVAGVGYGFLKWGVKKGIKSFAARGGILRSAGNGTWVSRGGLRYGADPNFGNRVRHLLNHASDIPTRPGRHGVFDAGRRGVLGVVDEAWAIAQRGGSGVSVSTQGARTVYTVDMGRRVGFVGGQAGAAAGNPAASSSRARGQKRYHRVPYRPVRSELCFILEARVLFVAQGQEAFASVVTR